MGSRLSINVAGLYGCLQRFNVASAIARASSVVGRHELKAECAEQGAKLRQTAIICVNELSLGEIVEVVFAAYVAPDFEDVRGHHRGVEFDVVATAAPNVPAVV